MLNVFVYQANVIKAKMVLFIENRERERNIYLLSISIVRNNQGDNKTFPR